MANGGSGFQRYLVKFRYYFFLCTLIIMEVWLKVSLVLSFPNLMIPQSWGSSVGHGEEKEVLRLTQERGHVTENGNFSPLPQDYM